MPTFRTPGVFVEEVSTFPKSVAEVETAIPAFIGYTEKATDNADDDLLKTPTRIDSLEAYENHFGGAYDAEIKVRADDAGGSFSADITLPDLQFILHYCMRLYFANGGGPCFVVSVGNYTSSVTDTRLLEGLDAIRREDEPTLLVIPEAAILHQAAAYTNVVQAMLMQCGDLGDRFSIFDIPHGTKWLTDIEWGECRNRFGTSSLKYAAAYFPFLKTSLNYHLSTDNNGAEGGNVKVSYPDSNSTASVTDLAMLRTGNRGLYDFILSRLKDHYVVLPPSAAIAGIYVKTDRRRGVWKAPANVALNSVMAPAVNIDSQMQKGMNVDPVSGKSVNAIRSFTGKGSLVWGARTLAGNDNEWRYISVRRFFNTVEESFKKSIEWVVFESNDENTWVKVRSMLENYLVQKWREGALAGSKPEQAFFVHCGLGTTMTELDILEGRLIVEIGMAVIRPAEFIILRFFHKMPAP
ncbi:MAG: phage tail sheath C-terminal domain-containing protein [Xanthomonadales bacterium]|nr:phage tail sheath C-terminal domain-containing protein [Xanthomonadales bacterium]